jgi:hypothetical protein
MTREEAIQYKARYEAVNAFEIEELRSMSLEQKLEQTSALMDSVEQMGWSQAMADEETQVRERWLRLKRAYSSDR